MSVEDNNDGNVLRYRQRLEAVSSPSPPTVLDGGGGSSSGLSSWQHDIERRLGRIEDRIMVLPTRSDFLTYVVGGLGLGLAAMGILAGGLVSGLGWLETRVARVQPVSAIAAPVQPIVVQMPANPEPKSHQR